MKKELKKLNSSQRRLFVQCLCEICDRDFGNGEVEPSMVFDPNEMVQMFLIDCSEEQYEEALKLTLETE